MKHTILLAGILGVLGLLGVACTVDAGVDPGPGGDCAVSCGDALANGGVPCDSASASAYDDLQSCGCDPSTCADACGGFCNDEGEDSNCGDCLAQFCGPEHDTCANN